ncbi:MULTISPECIES: RAMP superfamily CRISPR-associated protein [unclassified Synechococcus]|uniref:RAMP superfamily CRISPR-associated protein n=1 Tax=unclassified Synechococcus TaxID=2626047 RepID=UPI0021A8BAA1|nr:MULTISPECIES: RAMP superfamily CRISPR-associated protein [unclassified Synechococcus]MCT0212423.1 hypothetical protein [Synechococcus sp. CS-1326]MCT0234606.1 hypothetical protein [Synechococcus sp. CS-1327]
MGKHPKRRGSGGPPQNKQANKPKPSTKTEDQQQGYAGSSLISNINRPSMRLDSPSTAHLSHQSTHPSTKASTPLFDQLIALPTHSLAAGACSEISSETSLEVDHAKVPMEYRAQVQGRCQRQKADLPDAKIWIQEWKDSLPPSAPFKAFQSDPKTARTFNYQVDWRLITNSGTDDGIIRPVIAAGGWPVIPGSSIKGLFRRGCGKTPLDKVDITKWCGSSAGEADKDSKSGILRFHGAWPVTAETNPEWKERLLDVAHPQQNWQLGFNEQSRIEKGREKHNANAIVSLFRPMIQISITSTEALLDQEWDKIKLTLERGLAQGIGGRTSAGYGSIQGISETPFLSIGLTGQGVASQLLDKTPEFRPNQFRAAIRGMAMRVLGGLTDDQITMGVVDHLFGGLGKSAPKVGLLMSQFTVQEYEQGSYGRGQATYSVSGQLRWLINDSKRSSEDLDLLRNFLYKLHSLVMVLGGFGRGSRRLDHSCFPLADGNFYRRNSIGTHWQWLQPNLLPPGLNPCSVEELNKLIADTRSIAGQYMKTKNFLQGSKLAPWREVIHPDRSLVWARKASGPNDSVSINWFHDQEGPPCIKKTDLTGSMGKVGRIWSRMYPIINSDTPLGSHRSPAELQQPKPDPFAKPVNPFDRGKRPGNRITPPLPHRTAREARPQLALINDFWEGEYLEIVTYYKGANNIELESQFLKFMKSGGGVDACFIPINFSTP